MGHKSVATNLGVGPTVFAAPIIALLWLVMIGARVGWGGIASTLVFLSDGSLHIPSGHVWDDSVSYDEARVRTRGFR